MRRLIEFVALRQAFSLQTLGKWDCARLKAVPRALLLVRLTDCLWLSQPLTPQATTSDSSTGSVRGFMLRSI